MGVVQGALDELPEAHRRLWLRARLVVRHAVRQHYVANHVMSEVLAVIADADTLVTQVVARFFASCVVQPGAGDEPLVAVLQGDAARRLLTTFPDAAGYDAEGAGGTAFIVLTSPSGARPGLSTCRVLERSRLQ